MKGKLIKQMCIKIVEYFIFACLLGEENLILVPNKLL